ncbi:MAG: BMP family lipoprotein [Sciscionella sp.]
MRGTALAAIALSGALALTGCAKDSGGNSGGNTSGSSASKCKTNPPPPAAPAAATSTQAVPDGNIDGSKTRVGLAYDVGGRGDASFNDAAARGLDKAKAKLHLAGAKETTASTNETEDAKQQRLKTLAQQGYNPIVTVGFAYSDALKAVAPQFPNTKFAIVDDNSVKLPNVTPLVFAEQQSSFLVGVAAAYKSKDCHIGFIGGVDTPLIQKFQAGFDAGAKAAAPNVKIENAYIKPAGDNSGFNDPTDANLKAKGELAKGADVIYQAAGASGIGVFKAVKAEGKLAIGVDSDQYKQPNAAPYKNVIITSALKRVDVAVYNFIAATIKGNLDTLPQRFDLKVNGVGYATSGGKIDDIAKILQGYKAQIISGAIKVPTTPSS